MAERHLPKLHTRVRFPSPAPNLKGILAISWGTAQAVLATSRQTKNLENKKFKKRRGPRPHPFSIIRGASDGGGAAEQVPCTRCDPANRCPSSRHWCTDCRRPGFDNLRSGRTARNNRDPR